MLDRYAMTVMANICAYSTMYAVLGLTSNEEKHVGPQDLHVFRVSCQNYFVCFTVIRGYSCNS